jgi:hypothetical protein
MGSLRLARDWRVSGAASELLLALATEVETID